jgi:large subunit ribosomal protein L19
MAATKQKYRRTSKGTFVRFSGLADRVAVVEKATMRADLPEYDPGDTVKVHVKIKEGDKERIQIFEGLIIARSNKGASRSFTVRKISHGVGVERIFLETSPKIAKLEIVQKGRVRRAKLYYLRNLEGKAARVEREVESNPTTKGSVSAESKATKGPST